jgi:hypothetical protein
LSVSASTITATPPGFLVVLAFRARGLLDGALDIVAWHGLRAGVGHGKAQAGVERGVGHAELGGDGDFAGELGKDLRTGRIALALAMHDILGV